MSDQASGKNPSIIAGCSVVLWKTYKRRDLRVCFQKTYGYLDAVTSSFQERAGAQRSYTGRGDYVISINAASSFLFTTNGSVMNYLEYNDQRIIRRLREKLRNGSKDILCKTTNQSVNVFNISCEESKLTSYIFARIAQNYRTAEIENYMNPAEFDEKEGTFSKIVNTEMLYRAVWAAKAILNPVKNGTFPVYTNCGNYRWNFLLPLAISVGILALLFAYSDVLKQKCYTGKFAQTLDSWYYGARLHQMTGILPSLSLHSSGRDIHQRPYDTVKLNFDEDNNIVGYKI